MPPTRPWRRWACFTIPLCLLGGLLLTILIAEACAIWTLPKARYESTRELPPGESAWIDLDRRYGFVRTAPKDPDPTPRFRRLEAASKSEWSPRPAFVHETGMLETVYVYAAPGLEYEAGVFGYNATDTDGVFVTGFRAGWPCPSLTAHVIQVSGGWSGKPMPAPVWKTATPSLTLLKPQQYLRQPRPLLLGPLWPGLIADTIFYASILTALSFAPGAIRRALRRRRGLCPACGYDKRSLPPTAVCPECGK